MKNEKKIKELIKNITAKQKLIDRHETAISEFSAELSKLMQENDLKVYQCEAGIAEYLPIERKTKSIDTQALYKKLKMPLFLKVVKYNATLAKPLIKSGVIDSKLIDSVTTTATTTGAPKLKVKAV